MLRHSAAVAVAALYSSTAFCQTSYDVADRLGLLPTPRRIALDGKQLALKDWQIVVSQEARLCRVGAELINARIEELGGQSLPLVESPSTGRHHLVVGACNNHHVRSAATAMEEKLTHSDPGEQGYVIRCGKTGGEPVVLAGGSDEQGALYACVTLCHMIQGEDGRVVLRSGRVRDWPDYKVRCNGSLSLYSIMRSRRPETMARVADSLRRHIDFCLRHKINYVHVRGIWTRPTPDERTRTVRRLMVDVCRYASARGIRTRFIGGIEIGRYLTEEQKKGAVVRKPGTSYMWSAHDAHREHARDTAAFLRDAQAGVYALHPIDSGGYLDPENWSRRGPACKAMYGDDQFKASLDQFKIYFDIIRKECPGIELEAVSYPYHYQFAVPEFIEQAQQMGGGMPHSGWVRGIEDAETARRVQKRLSDYHRGLGQGLQKDVTITFREAKRQIFLACGELYKGHPVTIWIYPDRNKGWLGTFCPQVRTAKTFWRPAMRDHYFVASSWARGNDARVQRLSQQEYLWSLDQPDASSDFTAPSRRYEVGGRELSDFQRQRLIPRVCRILYRDAAPVFEDLVASNVSLNYVLEPAAVASERGENLDEVDKYMGEQADAFERLYQRFDKLVSRLDETMTLPPDAEAWTLYWLKFTGIAAIKAELEMKLGRCRKLVAANSTDEALKLVASLRKELPALQERCDAIHTRVDRDERHTKEASFRLSVDRRLHSFRPADYGEVLTRLEDKANAAIALGVIPDHVAKQLKTRKIELCRFKPRFELKTDAKRGEGGWTNGQIVDFFTVEGERLAQFETQVWVLWDDRALYFYAQAYDPLDLKHKPSVPATTRDGSVFRDDCFEIFLDTNGDRRTYYHLAVSCAGAKYDAAKLTDGRPDRSWNPDWEASVARGRDLWIAEIFVPFAALGAAPKPGDVWHINLSRHRAARSPVESDEYSSIIPSAQNHRPDLFVPLVFTNKSRIAQPKELRATIENVKRYDQTTTYGYSTFLVFSPTIESDRSLVAQTVQVQVSDSTGKIVSKRQIKVDRIPGRWSPSKPIMMDLGQAHKGALKLTLSCGGKARSRDVRSFLIDAKGGKQDPRDTKRGASG